MSTISTWYDADGVDDTHWVGRVEVWQDSEDEDGETHRVHDLDPDDLQAQNTHHINYGNLL